MIDDIAAFNKARWEDLVAAGVSFSRPWLELDPRTARARVDPQGVLGPVEDRDVLCLAGGGGQQSVAFAMLGARVTVLDLTPAQLERDRQAAAHHGLEVRTLEGDMRDLSPFEDGAFDLVWHAHSLAFVPDARPVFDGVARVLRPGGLYRLFFTNPFVHGLWKEAWTGGGYPLWRPYVDGAEIESDDPRWKVALSDGGSVRVHGPREFRHALSGVVNGLVARGFEIRGLWESAGEGNAEGGKAAEGTWAHFQSIAPPWLTVLSSLR